MPSKIKPITFYPSPEVRAWYQTLGEGEGSKKINKFLNLVIEASGRPLEAHLEVKADRMLEALEALKEVQAAINAVKRELQSKSLKEKQPKKRRSVR
jgi:hypothetical protein